MASSSSDASDSESSSSSQASAPATRPRQGARPSVTSSSEEEGTSSEDETPKPKQISTSPSGLGLVTKRRVKMTSLLWPAHRQHLFVRILRKWSVVARFRRRVGLKARRQRITHLLRQARTRAHQFFCLLLKHNEWCLRKLSEATKILSRFNARQQKTE
jgi:hypothetical protein